MKKSPHSISLGEITAIHFSVLGFYASIIFVLSWLIAPIFGWIYRVHCGRGRLVFPAALGLFLGGLIIWFSAAASLTPSWTWRLLLTASTPLLFLIGALACEIADRILRIKYHNHTDDDGQAPTDRPPARWWRRLTRQRDRQSHLLLQSA